MTSDDDQNEIPSYADLHRRSKELTVTTGVGKNIHNTVGHASLYIREARSFLDAARLIDENGNNFTSVTYHLLSQAIELALKAQLLGFGTSDRELRKKKLGHHLDELLKEAKKKGYKPSNPETETTVNILATTHSEHTFRYQKLRNQYTIPGIHFAFDVAQSIVSETEFHIYEVLMPRMTNPIFKSDDKAS